MEVDVRTTPRTHDRSRLLYERSVFESNTSRTISIGLDTGIETLHDMLASKHISVSEASQAVEHLAKMAIMKGQKGGSTDSFTDYNRVLSTAMFARERMLAPLIYALDNPNVVEIRSQLSDGTEGTSTELISEYMDMLCEVQRRGYHEQAQQIRGAIQEQTAVSLLNFDQTSSRLCVPAATYDDIMRGTDLYEYYYDTATATGYRHDISIKSTVIQKEMQQKFEGTEKIVIAAEEFGNLDLSVSDLLVRHSKGAPGLTQEEMAELRTAKNIVINLLKDQSQGHAYDALPAVYDEDLEAQLFAA